MLLQGELKPFVIMCSLDLMLVFFGCSYVIYVQSELKLYCRSCAPLLCFFFTLP